MKAVMDATGSLWQTGTLIGKPAGTFFSTGSQGGGQETTALTFMTQLVHHGMIFVPIGWVRFDGATRRWLRCLEFIHYYANAVESVAWHRGQS